MKIRRSYDHLISKMRFPILVRWHLYIESGARAVQALFVIICPEPLGASQTTPKQHSHYNKKLTNYLYFNWKLCCTALTEPGVMVTLFMESIENCHSRHTSITAIAQMTLTYWGRVTHICISKLTIIGSDNGLSPGRRQAIIWTNAGILLIGPLGTNFIEILIGIQTFSFKKMHLKISSVKWRPFCLGLNMLNKQRVLMHRHQGWNVRHGLCHIYMRYVYIYMSL